MVKIEVWTDHQEKKFRRLKNKWKGKFSLIFNIDTKIPNKCSKLAKKSMYNTFSDFFLFIDDALLKFVLLTKLY